MLLLLVCLLYFAALIRPSHGAFVRSYMCPADPTYFSNFLTNATYNERSGEMNFQLRAFALKDVYDVNSTTNMYTTLHFSLKYVDEVIIDRYLRLCDIAQIDHQTTYIVPEGVFPGLNNMFTFNGVLTHTVTSLMAVNATTEAANGTSSGGGALSTAESLIVVRSNNTANEETNFLPVGIQKRMEQTSTNANFSSRYNKEYSLPSIGSGGILTLPESIETSTVVLPTTVYTSAGTPETNTRPNLFSEEDYSTSQDVSGSITSMDPASTETAESQSATLTSSASTTAGSSCPVYKDNEVILNLSADVGHRSAFGSFEIEIEIIAGDYNHTVIACSRSFVSVVQNKKLSKFMTSFFAILLGLIAVSNAANIILSPYQNSDDPFLMPAAMICNAPLLNQETPSFADFLIYLHFVFFMSGLNLHYPGFLSPLAASYKWVALFKAGSVEGESTGNVYQTIYTGGLKALLNGDGNSTLAGQWKWVLIDFVLLFVTCVFFQNASTNIVYAYRRFKGKPVTKSYTRSAFFFNVGIFIHCVLRLAYIPIVSVALFMLATANGSPYGGPRYHELTKTWCVVVAALIFVLTVALIAYFCIRYIFPQKGREKLYTSLKVMLVWHRFYSAFNVLKVRFVMIEQFDLLIFSISVGALQISGTAQVVLIIFSKLLYLILLVLYKPYYSKTRMNRNKIAIVLATVVIAFMHVPFIDNLRVSEGARTRIVCTIFVIHLVVVVLGFLFPTLHNIYLCCRWYYKYRKGTKGIEIPDYMDHGDQIELPFADQSSLSSRGTFSDMDTMPPLSPSVSEMLHDASSSSSDGSLHTGEIHLTDSRAVSGLSIQNLKKEEPRSAPMTTRDWTTREADLYYEAHRMTKPDPEVRQLWEDRSRRLNQANQNRSVALSRSATGRRNRYLGYYPSAVGGGSPAWLKKVYLKRPAPTKSFEVMRPHPLMRSATTTTFTTNQTTITSDTYLGKQSRISEGTWSDDDTPMDLDETPEDIEEFPEETEADSELPKTIDEPEEPQPAQLRVVNNTP